MTEILLEGCQAQPLAHYLKAIGIHRLVAEQKNPEVKGAWTPKGYRLETRLTAGALERFLLEEYRPTPVLAPWNSGAGFYADDNQEAIQAIEKSTLDRFASYRENIQIGRALIASYQLDRVVKTKNKAEDKEAKKQFDEDRKRLKPEILAQMRARATDAFLPWMDAVVVLQGDADPGYAPLLGSGGNDGHLDFTQKMMAHLLASLLPSDPSVSLGWLKGALYGHPVASLTPESMGLYYPSATGGVNATAGFEGESMANPWDYILMLEGTIAFAAASTRRYEHGTAKSAFPFAVHVSHSGYASAGDDTARRELWLPEWFSASSWREVSALMREGRASLGTRAVRDGTDFARAFASLGVNRGIHQFRRYSMLKRNGTSYQAVPLGAWAVRESPELKQITPEIDQWLNKAKMNAKAAAPKRALRAVEEAIFALAHASSAVVSQDLLFAFASLEEALSHSSTQKEPKTAIKPLPWFSSRWLKFCDDGTVEYRIALALASRGLRHRLNAIDPTKGYLAFMSNGSPFVLWSDRPLVENLLALLAREQVELNSGKQPQPPGAHRVSDHEAPTGDPENRKRSIPRPRASLELADVAAFIEGEVDDTRVDRLIRAFSLVQPSVFPARAPIAFSGIRPPAAWGYCALAHHLDLPRIPGLLQRLSSGDAQAASRLAVRRLQSSGLAPLVSLGKQPVSLSISEPALRARRIGAALALPISPSSLEAVRKDLLQSSNPSELE